MKRLFQMRNLKLLNRKYLLIILISLFLGFNAQSQEPIDIWNVEEKSVIEPVIIIKTKNTLMNSPLLLRLLVIFENCI